MTSLNLLFLFAALCVLSSLFSAIEIGLFSVPRVRARRLSQEPGMVGEVFRRLLEAPHRVLVQILLGNNLAIIAATAVAAVLLDRAVRGLDISEWILIGAETVLLTGFMLVVCEVTPKTIALERNEQVAPWFARLYGIVRPVLAPGARLLEGIADAVARVFRGGATESLTADELERLVAVGAREGTLNPEESRLFRGAFRFGERTAAEIFVPRADVLMAEADLPVRDAIALVADRRRSRLPVYERTLDRVIGVLYAKDLLPWTMEDPGDRTVRSIMRPPFVAPADTGLAALLRAFQAERVHLAVIADRDGRALGIVTLEDVLEEIVGEIADEFDEEEPAYRPIGEHSGVFLGSVQVSEANRLLRTELPGLPGETLAGLCARLRPEAPVEGESFSVDGARVVVEAVTGRRAWSVRVERTS